MTSSVDTRKLPILREFYQHLHSLAPNALTFELDGDHYHKLCSILRRLDKASDADYHFEIACIREH